MPSAQDKVLGDYYGINPETLDVERVTRTDYDKLVRDGQEFSSRGLQCGKATETEIEDAFGLRDIAFVPEPMRGTILERMTVEELKRQASDACRARERRLNSR